MAKPYHHGDLPAALLEAADEILRTDGLSGLTLRAVARRAGVSHTAPAPHFGDLTGLLSALAAKGYRLFNHYLRRAQENPGRWSVPTATAHAYVAFARDHKPMFLLMFRSERLDFTRLALAEAAQEASMLLMRSTGTMAHDGPPSLAVVGRAVGNWAVVHGFALLLIDGRLDGALALCGGDVDALLDAALAG
jgi:AcrR family transcriptional regulator